MFLVFPRWRLRISVFALPLAIIMLWWEGFLPFLILILSALIHELGHIFAMKRLGHIPRRIDVLPMGALIVCPEGICYKQDMLIALSGPLVSLLTGVFFLAVYFVFNNTYLLFCGLSNLVLCLFNMLPIKKLDGGKALYCYLLWRRKDEIKTQRFCLWVSVWVVIFFVIFTIAFYFKVNQNFGVGILLAVLISQILQK